MKLTKEQYENFLDGCGCPKHDHPENGGRVPWKTIKNNTYGGWLRKNDPIAFEVGYQEWVQETRNS